MVAKNPAAAQAAAPVAAPSILSQLTDRQRQSIEKIAGSICSLRDSRARLVGPIPEEPGRAEPPQPDSSIGRLERLCTDMELLAEELACLTQFFSEV